MNSRRSSWEAALSESVERCLRPLIRVLLRFGMGATEFCSIAKSIFVEIASEEYGVRGRPTNVSRVAAMTGLSRKEVSRIRSFGKSENWRPNEETTPLNWVLHHWCFDPDFSISPGVPRALPMDGEASFSTLVARYAGDIPPGAIRRELEARGAVRHEDRSLRLEKRFVSDQTLDENFVRGLAFSLEALCTTLAHNARLADDGSSRDSIDPTEGHLERIALTSRMTDRGIEQFRRWVREAGAEFIEQADSQIGERELPKVLWKEADPRTVGVGIYYFEIYD